MKRIKRGMLASLFATLFATLLLTGGVTTVAAAAVKSVRATAQTCGTWSVVPSPGTVGSSNILRSVAAVATNDIWAVGGSTFGFATPIEHWNGTIWSVVPTPNVVGAYHEHLNSVAAVATNDVWAVGTYSDIDSSHFTLIEHWDGISWSVVTSPANGYSLNSVAAIAANDVWAAGSESIPGQPIQPLVEHWNGTSWSIVPTPNPNSIFTSSLNGVTVISSTDIWVAGSYEPGNVGIQPLVEHWNGASWSIVPTPSQSQFTNILTSITAVSSNDIWAVGYHYNSNALYQTLIEHWDGSSWTVASSPNVGSGNNSLSGVAAISTNDVWAVGAVGYSIATGSGQSQTLIEHWNGKTWSVVSSPSPGTQTNALNGVTTVAGNIWAVGYSITGGANQSLTEFFC